MALTQNTTVTNNISTLDPSPNDVGGLTASALQYLFDKFGVDFKAFFNDVHLAEIALQLATKAEVADVVAGGVADGTVTDAKLSNTAGQIKDVVNAHQSDNLTHKGFVGYAKPITGITDLNLLLESGVYSGIFTGAHANEPYSGATNRRVTIIVTGTIGFVHQEIRYEDVIFTGQIYHRRYVGTWSAWAGVATLDSTGAFVQKPFVTGTYNGDATASRTISLGFTPSAVLIQTSTGAMDMTNSSTQIFFGGFVTQGAPLTRSEPGVDYVIQITTNGFIVYYNPVLTIYVNNSTRIYNYIAFR